jgi:hypothetical protein
MSEPTNEQAEAEPTVAEKRATLRAAGKPVGLRGKLSKQAEQDFRELRGQARPQV